MHFLCDAIELKLSVEGTLKVLGKSLKTVLNEFHFIVHLYSFTPCFPGKPFFPHGNSFAPLIGRTTSKTPHFINTSTKALVCIFSSNLSHS